MTPITAKRDQDGAVPADWGWLTGGLAYWGWLPGSGWPVGAAAGRTDNVGPFV